MLARLFVLLSSCASAAFASPAPAGVQVREVFFTAGQDGVVSEVVLALDGPRALVLREGGGYWIPINELLDPRRHAPTRAVRSDVTSVLVPTLVVGGEIRALRARAVERVVSDANGLIFALTVDASVLALSPGARVDVTPAIINLLDLPRAIAVHAGQTPEAALRAYGRDYATRAGYKPVSLSVTTDYLGTYAFVDLASFRADADARLARVNPPARTSRAGDAR